MLAMEVRTLLDSDDRPGSGVSLRGKTYAISRAQDPRWVLLGCLAVSVAAAQTQPAPGVAERGALDLVLANGRVIDPETGLDGVRSVGIREGRIAVISRTPLRGRTVLDASGLVVAPGFIDLHAHGQDLPAARMRAFDGVTTALELEAGTLPVAAAYDLVGKEGRPINYGFSASWLFARIAEKEGMEPTGAVTFFQDAQRRTGWQHSLASSEETARIIARVEQGLQDGALGIGVLAGYAPSYGRKEAFAVAQLAAQHGVPTFTHVRYMSVIEPQSSFEAIAEIVSLAAATGAQMHVVHLNSTSTRDIPRIAELLRGAQGRGLKITTEAYPYGAGSTVVGAELFRGNWKERRGGATAGDIELAGVPFTDETLAEAQAKAPGTWIVAHFMRPDRNPADQALLDQSVLMPGGAIASDAIRGRRKERTSPAMSGRCRPMRSPIPGARGRSPVSCATTCGSARRRRCSRACVE